MGAGYAIINYHAAGAAAPAKEEGDGGMNVRHQLRTVDLDALRGNVRLLREALPAGTRLLAVVKADAYGHGMAQVARAAIEAGAAYLAVATAEEGAALRHAGIRDVPVLVLGKSVKSVNLGTRATFADIAATVTELLGVQYSTPGKSFAGEIL